MQSVSPGATESELIEQIKFKFPLMKAEDIADAVHYVLSTPEHVQVNSTPSTEKHHTNFGFVF